MHIFDCKSVQIDHVIVSPHGIFVVETKNFGGIPYGEKSDACRTHSRYAVCACGRLWGNAPYPAALMAKDYFRQTGVKAILVPGCGYGRNSLFFA